jgi:hypothetical protein
MFYLFETIFNQKFTKKEHKGKKIKYRKYENALIKAHNSLTLGPNDVEFIRANKEEISAMCERIIKVNKNMKEIKEKETGKVDDSLF